MRIGFLPILNPNSGGIYQYSLTMLEALAAIGKEGLSHEFSLLYSGRKDPPLASTALPWPLIPLRQSRSFPREVKRMAAAAASGGLVPGDRTRRSLVEIPSTDRYFPKFKRWIAQRLGELGIELMIFPAPSALSFESGFPYVIAIHDLQHRLQPEFPEVSANGEWEKREYLFRNVVRFATLLIADSETGKEDILECYAGFGATPDRVKVLPYLPAVYLSTPVSQEKRAAVRVKYRLTEPYFFYPAQFWPHKNHLRITKALGLLRERDNLTAHVVFCGSYAGEIREETFQQTMQVARELSVDRQIHYLGYVADQDMPPLYAEAVGLIMPTFFGPTNIPVLEAWEFGCAVITSDIRGIREQVGDAGVLVDPRSVESIAEAIYRLWRDDSLRRKLAEAGRRRLESYSRDDHRRQLRAIVQEAAERAPKQTPSVNLRPAYSR